MKLSTKGRYAVRALFDMAYHGGMSAVQIHDIARRQGISARYLEQIFSDLKKAGLLKSRRGPQGGYILARKPAEISVGDILLAAEGDISLVRCTKNDLDCTSSCDAKHTCVTHRLWDDASRILHGFFDEMTLQGLCEKGKELGLKKEIDHKFMYFI